MRNYMYNSGDTAETAESHRSGTAEQAEDRIFDRPMPCKVSTIFPEIP